MKFLFTTLQFLLAAFSCSSQNLHSISEVEKQFSKDTSLIENVYVTEIDTTRFQSIVADKAAKKYEKLIYKYLKYVLAISPSPTLVKSWENSWKRHYAASMNLFSASYENNSGAMADIHLIYQKRHAIDVYLLLINTISVHG